MIGIASDHAGFNVKSELIKYIELLGYQIKDFGTYNEDSVDYPDYAFKVGNAVLKQEIEQGILICKTGIGMSIACNKIKGIRCAKVDNIVEAKLSKEHNNSNVLAISALKNIEELKEIVKIYLETKFTNDDRHLKRLGKIDHYGC